jgi:hypothetical protein
MLSSSPAVLRMCSSGGLWRGSVQGWAVVWESHCRRQLTSWRTCMNTAASVWMLIHHVDVGCPGT